MRMMTFPNIKKMAVNILTVYTYNIANLKKIAKKCAENEISLEEAFNERNSLAAAFTVMGLLTDDDAKAIFTKKFTKAEIAQIVDSPLWHCAMAKTDKPVAFGNPLA